MNRRHWHCTDATEHRISIKSIASENGIKQVASTLHDHGTIIGVFRRSVPRRPSHVRGLGKSLRGHVYLISRNTLFDCQKFDMLYDTLEVFGDRQTCGSAPRESGTRPMASADSVLATWPRWASPTLSSTVILTPSHYGSGT